MGTKDIIKQRRIELGLTMKELANKVGVSEATISRWESGNIATMKQTKIALLAKVLGISPAILVSGELSSNHTNTDDTSNAEIAKELALNPVLKEFVEAAKVKPKLVTLGRLSLKSTDEELDTILRVTEAIIKENSESDDIDEDI